MVLILIYWLYITLFIFLAGSLFEKALIRLVTGPPNIKTPFPIRILEGIIGLLFVLGLIHFFYPINENVHMGILIIILAELFFRFDVYKLEFRNLSSQIAKLNFSVKITVFLIIVVFSYIATDQPFYNLDEGRYHLQSLLWSKSYKIIPGIANLHDRFASNSSWYLLNALFDVFYFSKKVFHIVNSLFLLYLFLFCIVCISLSNKVISIFNCYLVSLAFYLVFSFSFFRYWFMIGVTPDFGVHFITIAYSIYMVWLLDNEREQNENFSFHSLLIFTICVSSFSVRSSGVGFHQV